MLHRVLAACLSIVAATVLVGCGSAPPQAGAPPAGTAPTSASTAPVGTQGGRAPSAATPPRTASAPAPAGAASAPPAAPHTGPLAAELRWLAELFDGTPVQVVGERGGAVRLEVPLRFAFDRGSTEPKPALQAVLDRLGQSLKRQPNSRLAQWAPGAEGEARRQAMRLHLIGLGLPSHRVSAVAPPSLAYAVCLRLSLPSAPVQRVGSNELPALTDAPLGRRPYPSGRELAPSGGRAGLRPPPAG